MIDRRRRREEEDGSGLYTVKEGMECLDWGY